MPRIISGSAGGIPIKAPPGRKTRPTTDRIKETVFNILQGELTDAEVLDLFAGSGSLGMEALSRGAHLATFIEADPVVCRTISENLIKTRLSEHAQVYGLDMAAGIRMLALKGARFTLVFADPPYLQQFVMKTLQILDENDIMMNNGILVVEHHHDEPTPQAFGCLIKYREKAFGETCFSFFQCQK